LRNPQGGAGARNDLLYWKCMLQSLRFYRSTARAVRFKLEIMAGQKDCRLYFVCGGVAAEKQQQFSLLTQVLNFVSQNSTDGPNFTRFAAAHSTCLRRMPQETFELSSRTMAAHEGTAYTHSPKITATRNQILPNNSMKDRVSR
jgi:hypothetical protein